MKEMEEYKKKMTVLQEKFNKLQANIKKLSTKK